MKTNVLIMAQGAGYRWEVDDRWPNIDVPASVKQFIPLGKETIITRTLRQVSPYVSNPLETSVRVVMNLKHSRQLPLGTVQLPLEEPTGRLLRGIWVACKLIGRADKTVILLGDVIYSHNAILKIFAGVEVVSLYGRLSGNPITGKEAKELFALSFLRKRYDLMMGLMLDMVNDDNIEMARLWNLYDFFGFIGEKDVFVLIEDYTDDVDSQQEYVLFFDKLRDAALEDDK